MVLRLTQYNMHKSKKQVQTAFVAQAAKKGCEIIALQEPWQNTHMNATHCPGSSGFWPAYPKQFRSKACFLVRKTFPLSSWSVEYPAPDIASLTMQINDQIIHIHNVYSKPPRNYTHIDQNSPIFKLPELLKKPGEHVLLGDFNLHHPIWGGPQCFTRHNMVDELLHIVNEADLQLLTPPGTITWEDRGQSSTVDLIFSTAGLEQRVVSCCVDSSLENGSDHHPISTQFSLDRQPQVVERRRNWKKMDTDSIAAGSQHLQLPQNLRSPVDIEDYTGYLLGFINQLIENTVPWSKPAPEYSCRWWTPEVQSAVHQARAARHQRAPTEEIRALNQAKKKVIHRAKTAQFRKDVHEAATGKEGIWKLARWAKERSHLPPEPPIVPPLYERVGSAEQCCCPRTTLGGAREAPQRCCPRTTTGEAPGEPHCCPGTTTLPSGCPRWRAALTTQEKADMLRRSFFPEEPQADLSDMNGFEYGQATEPLPQVTKDDILNIMDKQKKFSAPGLDGTPNAFLKAMGEPFAEATAALTQACWQLAYYPKHFRRARTIALRKAGKDFYTSPRAWRPIALLNTVGKIIEAATAEQIRRMAEEHNMLPAYQMGARQGRSTETALDLLVNQVHEIWRDGDHVASLLSLDITGAYDRVVRDRMVHVLRAKGIPEQLAEWVRAFMTDRTSTLVLSGTETEEKPISAGVPQGSPLSPILYLFYAAELLEACNSTTDRLSASAFVDDTTLLAYGQTTEGNCRILESAHNRCLDWARRYGASFAPEKYDLIHLSRRPKKFNMQAQMQLGSLVKAPTTSVRVLGVWLDPKLRWGEHVKVVLGKMKTQTNALIRTTASTWGATFASARQIYSAVVRPALAFGAAVWHPPQSGRQRGKRALPRGPAARLRSVQNKCLRIVSGAYRATPISVLETETFTPPLDLYLDARLAQFRLRHKESGMEQLLSGMPLFTRQRVR